jgi:hypothetical protein
MTGWNVPAVTDVRQGGFTSNVLILNMMLKTKSGGVLITAKIRGLVCSVADNKKRIHGLNVSPLHHV